VWLAVRPQISVTVLSLKRTETRRHETWLRVETERSKVVRSLPTICRVSQLYSFRVVRTLLWCFPWSMCLKEVYFVLKKCFELLYLVSGFFFTHITHVNQQACR
jgi:hypothetical protein